MTKKVIATAIFLVVGAVLLIKGKALLAKRQEQIKALPAPSERTVWISTVRGEEGTLRQTRSALAQIEAQKSIALSTKLPGYIKKVRVQEAQKVRKGELLVRIDAYEVRANLTALKKRCTAQKSDLDLARSIYKRNEKLFAVGGISKERLEASKVAMQMKASAYEDTRQKIAQLEHQLTYLDIRAPFEGVVEQVLLHEGDFAAVGKPILRINDGKKRLLFRFSPNPDAPIKEGQRVFLGKKRIGHIKSLYPTAQNGLNVAEAALDVPLSSPVGSFVDIEVVTKEARGCILPDTTLVHNKEGTDIMVYRHGRFVPEKVTPLLVAKGRILLKTCPNAPVASAAETRLSELPSYGKVRILGARDAH